MPRKFKTEEAKRKNYDYHNNYNKENYRNIKIKLRNTDDADLIKRIQEESEKGRSYSEIARTALRHYYEKSTR